MGDDGSLGMVLGEQLSVECSRFGWRIKAEQRGASMYGIALCEWAFGGGGVLCSLFPFCP